MTKPLVHPKRKDPLKKTRVPLLPQGVRSRTALGLTAAAAEGRFRLQVCAECAAVIYPPRDACPRCLSARLPFQDVADGGTLLAETTIRTSTDVYFRERMPWRIGTVQLDAGPSIVAHLHGDLREGERTRLQLKIDKSGQAIAMALPAEDTPNMADDPQWRELTCDPKFRRVLITDGRHAVGDRADRTATTAAAHRRILLQILKQLFIARLPGRFPMDRDRRLSDAGVDGRNVQSGTQVAGAAR